MSTVWKPAVFPKTATHSRDSPLWAITSYYNPAGYGRRLWNYRIFRRFLHVPLITVELSFDGVFELSEDDADRLVQVRGGDVMFQKERLLNVALAHLPAECSAVAWLDCDVVFADTDWPLRTLEALETHSVVQPWDRYEHIGPDFDPDALESTSADSEGNSIAHVLSGAKVQAGVFGRSFRALGISDGFAWAAKREILDRHGLYDACIVGSGGRVHAGAMSGRFREATQLLCWNSAQWEHYLRWAEPFFKSVKGRVGSCPGLVRHLWHGDLAKRLYIERHAKFERFGFDPYIDVSVMPSGCFSWNSDKPDMHEYLRDYFRQRLEDGSEAKRDSVIAS